MACSVLGQLCQARQCQTLPSVCGTGLPIAVIHLLQHPRQQAGASCSGVQLQWQQIASYAKFWQPDNSQRGWPDSPHKRSEDGRAQGEKYGPKQPDHLKRAFIPNRKPAIKRPARHQWFYCGIDYDPMIEPPDTPLPPYAPKWASYKALDERSFKAVKAFDQKAPDKRKNYRQMYLDNKPPNHGGKRSAAAVQQSPLHMQPMLHMHPWMHCSILQLLLYDCTGAGFHTSHRLHARDVGTLHFAASSQHVACNIIKLLLVACNLNIISPTIPV